MQNLIEHKGRLFWALQIGGWMAFCAVRTLNGIALGNEPDFFYTVVISVAGGFVISLVLRYGFKILRAASFPPVILILSVLFCVGVGAVTLSFIEVWAFSIAYDTGSNPKGWEFAGRTLYDFFVLLNWTGIYFVINYYALFQQQKEMYLQANALAHQAQLKMLRYQINPHFLFNTLNAISTLVLDKQTQEANTMLSRLSAFLRFSLINQPLQKMTLQEEVKALWLYLDIEKVRFQDRLKLDFQVSDAAQNALVPSLILQPLVENAIKYAVAPSENGGTISLDGKIDGDRLVFTLSDDGPGLGNIAQDSEKSSGVGITNTRARLAQLYGDNHDFHLENISPQGLQITISIPHGMKGDGP